MSQGYFCLVLHAHLPFVRHPEFDDCLEEDWLFEAITESYLPLLQVFDNLDRDGIDWRLTLSISPTLAAMLSDPLLQIRYVRYLDNGIALAHKEVHRTHLDPHLNPLARMYLGRFEQARTHWVNRLGHQLLPAFRSYAARGQLELITTCATHGFLPLMLEDSSRRAQIEQGAREHARLFGQRPRGFWLAECGYGAGVDSLLRKSGLDYFFLDTHGITYAHPRPPFAVYAAVRCADSGVAAFGRDSASSQQVWSSIEGYPGDFAYRERYRDVGFDLDYDYVKPHLHSLGVRSNLGIKYHRITGPVDLADKQYYDRAMALQRVEEHAEHFVQQRSQQAAWLKTQMGKHPPIIVAPFDAELFGHWWFEGPEFLESLFRALSRQKRIRPITPSEYLGMELPSAVVQPGFSSWGDRGYANYWLDERNDWIYRHLHVCEERMAELAREFSTADPLTTRALNQAARELMLAQASDWAFIMKAGTVVQYAEHRTRTHVEQFLALEQQIRQRAIDATQLGSIEHRDNLFPEIDYRLYA